MVPILIRLLALLFATLALWMQALELLMGITVKSPNLGYWHGPLLIK